MSFHGSDVAAPILDERSNSRVQTPPRHLTPLSPTSKSSSPKHKRYLRADTISSAKHDMISPQDEIISVKEEIVSAKEEEFDFTLRQPLETVLVKANDLEEYIDDVNKKFNDLRKSYADF